jgi:hypothetical protein
MLTNLEKPRAVYKNMLWLQGVHNMARRSYRPLSGFTQLSGE